MVAVLGSSGFNRRGDYNVGARLRAALSGTPREAREVVW